MGINTDRLTVSLDCKKFRDFEVVQTVLRRLDKQGVGF